MLASTTSSDSTLLSASSSSSNSSASSILNNNNNHNSTTSAHKTMEEVWKDITITSLPNTPISHIHTIHHPTPSSHYKGFFFQDFFNGGPETRRNPSIRSSIDSPPPQTKPTSQTQEFQFFDNELMNSQTHNFQIQGNSSVPSFIDGVATFDALASSSVLATFGGGYGGGGGGGDQNKKRFCEGDEEGSVDRRHKRMIKNRESAARSRARKQAYVVELEREVDNLKVENELLKRQQRQLLEAQSAQQLPQKHGLHRTSTAPF